MSRIARYIRRHVHKFADQGSRTEHHKFHTLEDFAKRDHRSRRNARHAMDQGTQGEHKI